MTGTIINIITVLIGGTIGLIFSARLPEKILKTVVSGIGLFTAAIGIQMFLETRNPIVVLGSILVGGVLGEWWQIEDRLSNLGGWLEKKFMPQNYQNHPGKLEPIDYIHNEKPVPNRFIRGFLTASLVFCVGPMTILGSIQDGLTGDFNLLAIKSVLDGFAAVAFAASLGVGVMFSTLVILVYQGGLSLLAFQAQAIITEPMMAEMTAAGGVLLIGLAISSLLEIKLIRVGNFLPALLIAPLIVGLLTWLNLF